MAHSQETPTLTATPRERTGTRYARRLRQAGRLPAVIYGHKRENVPVSVDEKDVLAILEHGAHIVTVNVEGGRSDICLVKDLQFGYLGDNVVHIDFTRVDLEEEVTVMVHLHFEGEPETARQTGAVLTHDLADLEVICKAGEIPEEIKVDLANMENIILVGEIQLPPGVRTELNPQAPVAHITFVHEEVAAEEVEVVGEVEPEVITEGAEAEAAAVPPTEEGGSSS